MSKRLVIALGGNALGKTPQEQLDLVKGTASTIVDLVEEGYDVVIGHGNGPQVGMVNLAFEYSANNGGGTPAMPFPECGAMTQGYIGYHLQQAVERELARRGINKPCAAVVTQVVVDKNDDAFQKPTKPVGMFYTKEDADRIVAETGYTFVDNCCNALIVARAVLHNGDATTAHGDDHAVQADELLHDGQLNDLDGDGRGNDAAVATAGILDKGVTGLGDDAVGVLLAVEHANGLGRLLESVVVLVNNHLGHHGGTGLVDATASQLALDGLLQVITDVTLGHGTTLGERHGL